VSTKVAKQQSGTLSILMYSLDGSTWSKAKKTVSH